MVVYKSGMTMDSVDLEVLKRSASWLESGRRVLLVTVVKTWGSSPRPWWMQTARLRVGNYRCLLIPPPGGAIVGPQ